MIYVLGTRSTSSMVADWMGADGFVENEWQETKEFAGLPVVWIGNVQTLIDLGAAFVIGIASSNYRKLYAEKVDDILSMNWAFGAAHPTAIVSDNAKAIGTGTIIGPGSVVDFNVALGDHVLINRGVMVGHETIVSNYATLSPGANICGCCYVGEAAYIGAGATMIDRVKVGANSFVAAGSVVVKDVPDNTAVRGVPAKPWTPHENSAVWDRTDRSQYDIR